MGCALQPDSRNAVATDLNADGRLDLVVTTFEVWPRVRQTVRVFRNGLTDAGHWIGVHLRPTARVSPLGAQVILKAGGQKQVRLVTSGDSHRSQQPWTVHFGLGTIEAVESVEIRWSGGRITRSVGPEIDRYHELAAP
jgi:hypothetical protein